MIMLSKTEHKVTDLNFFDRLFAQVLPSSPKPRTHNFTKQKMSVNYEFEEIDGRRGQMTGYGKGINVKDYIILTKQGIRYRVEAIEYYSEPADLWTALLYKCCA
ncbi:hypothetical protein [Floridanema aerugineum]|uniref:Uncharacterized protein n=1 Tax=Floridaenema aerugineum BLCC-F46 TaxID=3153654 RepID=A0ABV4X6L7_9CYAN